MIEIAEFVVMNPNGDQGGETSLKTADIGVTRPAFDEVEKTAAVFLSGARDLNRNSRQGG